MSLTSTVHVGSPGEIRIRVVWDLPSAGFSSGGGDPEPSSGSFLAPMLCIVPERFDHYTTGLRLEATCVGLS